LKDRELPLKLKAMAITPNKHELWDMKRFAEDDLGLEFKFDAMLNPRCDCSQSPLEVRLSVEEVVKLDLQDSERVNAWRELVNRNKGASRVLENSKAIWQCSSGLNTFAIDPYGMLRMCVISPDDGYNLRNGNFREGWEQFLYKLRQKEISKQTKCLTCVIRDMCGLCPANAALEGLDEEEPVDFLCQVAHLRAYAFDVLVPPHGDCEYCEGGSRHQEIMQKVKKLTQD
jgi:radical SAM protein with 4Fe4S-binding SPASM domain